MTGVTIVGGSVTGKMRTETGEVGKDAVKQVLESLAKKVTYPKQNRKP